MIIIIGSIKTGKTKKEDLVHSKFNGIIFYINFFENFQRPRFFKIHRRTGQRRIRYSK